MTSRRLVLPVLGLALALVAVGCSDRSGTTTVAAGDDGSDDVVFGSGELPETFPAEFPLPPGSSVGSTMVISSSGSTEAIVRVGAERETVAAFFDQELVRAGFEVDSSSDENGIWLIQFSRDGATGTVDITEPQPGISQIILRFNVP